MRHILTPDGVKSVHSSHGDVCKEMMGQCSSPCHHVTPAPVVGHEHKNHPEPREQAPLPYPQSDAANAISEHERARATGECQRPDPEGAIHGKLISPEKR